MISDCLSNVKYPSNFKLWVILAAVSCPEPKNLTNGYRTGHDFTFMKPIHYWCNPGYDLIGNKTRTCTASGMWTGSSPSCEHHFHHSKFHYYSRLCKHNYRILFFVCLSLQLHDVVPPSSYKSSPFTKCHVLNFF